MCNELANLTYVCWDSHLLEQRRTQGKGADFHVSARESVGPLLAAVVCWERTNFASVYIRFHVWK